MHELISIFRFLLAQLYIYSLAGKRSPASLRVALKALHQASSSSSDRSSVLDEAYNKSMERIQQLKGDLPHDGLLILSWLVKAKRQIKLAELQEALAVEIGASEISADNIPTVEHIIQACASLIIVEGDSIELVHYTAQEYFERPNNRWMQKAQANISNICMAYLSFSAFRDEPCLSEGDLNKRFENNPFYRYSTEHWGYHTNEALGQGLEASRVVEFLGHGLTRGSWYQNLLYAHFCSISPSELISLHPHVTNSQLILFVATRLRRVSIAAGLSPLHVAASFGLHDVVAKLLGEGYSPNAKDSLLRMPIWWAAWNGHTRVVELLLGVTTDLEVRDTQGLTPLMIATKRGYKTVVEVFLNKGANIEAQDDNNQTSLMWATMAGHEKLVQYFLEKGANIEAQDNNNRTSLMWATFIGHEKLVQYLLEKGANMEAMDSNNQTPLTKALQKKSSRALSSFLFGMVPT